MLLRPRLHARSGVTLIEIMLVIAIIALLSAGVAYGTRTLPRAHLQSDAQIVAALCRGAYVYALTSGHITRLSFNLKGNAISVEETDSNHTLDPHDPLKAGGAEQLEIDAKKAAELMADPRPRATRASFRAVKKPSLHSRELHAGARFIRLFSQHDEEPREEGLGAIYFFPGGESERAMLQLANPNGDVFTVIVHPLTGRVEVMDRAVEPPDQDDDEPPKDDVEIDNRDKPLTQESNPP